MAGREMPAGRNMGQEAQGRALTEPGGDVRIAITCERHNSFHDSMPPGRRRVMLIDLFSAQAQDWGELLPEMGDFCWRGGARVGEAPHAPERPRREGVAR